MFDTHILPHKQPALIRTSLQRIEAVDIVRGLAMIFMLLNHSSWHIPGLELEVNNSWYDRSPIEALDRSNPEAWLSILQGTPLFFVLAGFSIAFFEMSRYKRQWTERDITRYFLVRGSVLILIDLVLPGFVLSSIAICLWMMAYLRRLPTHYLVLMAVLLTLVMQMIYETNPIPDDVNVLRSIFLYPSPKDFMPFGYPVFQWIAVIILGYVSGRYAIANKHRFADYSLSIGLVSFVIWFIITADDQFGRLFEDHPMILTKHPPSLAYLTFYMGITFTLLSGCFRMRAFAESPVGRYLSLLGQVAFFFYISHFLVVLLVSAVVIHLPLPPVVMNFVVMIVSLVILFPICQKYRELRHRLPNSMLQYL